MSYRTASSTVTTAPEANVMPLRLAMMIDCAQQPIDSFASVSRLSALMSEAFVENTPFTPWSDVGYDSLNSFRLSLDDYDTSYESHRFRGTSLSTPALFWYALGTKKVTFDGLFAKLSRLDSTTLDKLYEYIGDLSLFERDAKWSARRLPLLSNTSGSRIPYVATTHGRFRLSDIDKNHLSDLESAQLILPEFSTSEIALLTAQANVSVMSKLIFRCDNDEVGLKVNVIGTPVVDATGTYFKVITAYYQYAGYIMTVRDDTVQSFDTWTGLPRSGLIDNANRFKAANIPIEMADSFLRLRSSPKIFFLILQDTLVARRNEASIVSFWNGLYDDYCAAAIDVPVDSMHWLDGRRKIPPIHLRGITIDDIFGVKLAALVISLAGTLMEYSVSHIKVAKLYRGPVSSDGLMVTNVFHPAELCPIATDRCMPDIIRSQDVLRWKSLKMAFSQSNRIEVFGLTAHKNAQQIARSRLTFASQGLAVVIIYGANLALYLVKQPNGSVHHLVRIVRPTSYANTKGWKKQLLNPAFVAHFLAGFEIANEITLLAEQ